MILREMHTKIQYFEVWFKPDSFFECRTKAAFDAKMQKSSKSTDFRVPLSICTMFNILMDAKKQYSKLCILDQGQEVIRNHVKSILYLRTHN